MAPNLPLSWAGRVIVLYYGRVVENSKTREILDSPKKEYTKALLNAVSKLPDDSLFKKYINM